MISGIIRKIPGLRDDALNRRYSTSCKWTDRDTEKDRERASERETDRQWNRLHQSTLMIFLKDSIHYIPLIYNKHTLIQL